MKKSLIDLGSFWAGTDQSLDQLVKTSELMAQQMASGHTFDDDDEEDELPYLLNIEDGIGRVEINGPMVNSNSPWNRFFGITNYSDIREAIVAAANNPEVHSILLDMDTGGGQVSGVSDVSDLVSMVDKNVKPVYAFSSGMIASAGYWIAVSAREIHVTESNMTGSIGVIATHMERSKMLEEMGINVTVMRAGKYKALAGPFEPLSEEAKAQVQEGLDHTYKMFVGHVAQNLGLPYEYVDDNMAQGREFYGSQTVQVGLTTSVTSFDKLISDLKANSIDKGVDLTNNSRNTITGFQMKTALNTQPAPEATANPVEIQATVAEAKNELVVFLQDQVAAKDSAILEANMKVKELEAKVSDQAAAFKGLIDIAANSINTMQVALKGASVDASSMSATQILAEHARVQETFQKQFPAGGVASVDATLSVENEPQKLDPLHAAKIAATRF